MMTRSSRRRRRGSMLPLMAVSVISLFAFVALAVDLGMLAVSRTQCQNAADAAALTACRTLNNNPGSTNNNLAPAVTNAKTTVTSNVNLSAKFTTAQFQKIEVGQYLYNTTSQTFGVSTWNDVTSSQTVTPPSGSWTAIRTTLSSTQPTYFMNVLGVTSMPTGAQAVAVYKPRDVAFVLDMTGSMAYASTFNYNNVSLNPDPMVPSFGHYGLVTSNLVATANQYDSNGQVISRNNFTMATPGGPPIVRTFVWDPANATAPSTSAYPVTSTTSSLLNAFHRWSPPESGGDSTNYVPTTYDFTGYNAYHIGTEATPKGPTPAPYSFQTMTDSTSPAITYVGDRYRRADGSINKTDTTWATGASSTKAAATAIELLGYNVSGSNVRGGTSGTTTITTVDKFRDTVWETNGYDLDVKAYRTWKTNSNSEKPGDPGSFSTQVAAADKFQGFSMGPGYWGKTFFMWPPDPRWGGGTGTPDPTSPNTASNPVIPKDTNGNWLCDWRRRFFLNSSGTSWTVTPGVSSATATAGVDASLFNTGSGQALAGSGYTINYAAVLKWLKTGPQVLPPNLRAGRILYYSSIPDDVNTGTGTAQQVLDKVFWRKYIDFVFGTKVDTNNYTSAGYLYGVGDSPAGFSQSVYASNLNPWALNLNWTSVTPYMNYADSPLRPRLHFWFGPLSLMNFLQDSTQGGPQSSNWMAGTVSEAQCWQLKAGMNSVIADVQANHPNDFMGMTMFASNSTNYQVPRVGTSQNYTALQNALFYPKSLLSGINSGNVTTEERPYNTSFSSVAEGEIPNANGGTNPNSGLAVAFNLLCGSASLPAATYGAPRRGASKLVIFETDGVPNAYANYTLTKAGYNTYYSNFTSDTGTSTGAQACTQPAIDVVTQMNQQLASTSSSGTNSGLSLPNAPVRVYPIAFGDLFDPVAAPNATFRPTALQFLANIAAAGNTGSSTATTINSNQIITGPYETRISLLKTCMQNIFQSGLSVTLIQ
ncbi:pilus assembly protein TadG-related protein [Frigoriglobus tundricola]|uniref:Putative Flp pilus-assembly TadG-like N-terminal domain-containing protein n=1 Tax=Frigoriglobus tundricola TaxID=2774151 RepID=A0A6M5YZI3_9BACT|nr:pilus assembly protein TadG-related protein [Frigoriglobus tundricola]QJW98840.1 hypothetical protein FTUN_6435 [Frigoriglobus tundricola]